MPPRTNACQTCRRKRIKCDATLPHCQQCIRAGRQCPGPTQGPIIIDQTHLAIVKARTKKIVPIPLSTRQPSSESMVSIAFVPEFILGFTCLEGRSGPSWIHALTDTDMALSLSLRATATAYCAVTAKNPSVLVTARRVYGEALAAQAKVVTQSTEPGIPAVCASVILSLFEGICATSTNAYVAHLQAAKRMLSLARPDQQKKASLRHVAMHVGYQLVYASIAGYEVDDKSLLSDLDTWMSLTDRTPSYAGQVLNLMVHLGDLHAGKTHDQPYDYNNIENIKNKLEMLWSDYRKQAAFQGTLMYREEDSVVQFPDPLAAMTVAYFETARILTFLIDSAKAPYTSHTLIDASSKSILHCARFLSRRNIGCSYLRMCLPLTLVGLHSANLQYRQSAKWFLEVWLGRTALGSLASVGSVRIRSTGWASTNDYIQT